MTTLNRKTAHTETSGVKSRPTAGIPAPAQDGGYACRACDGKERTTLLDMGDLPLANAFVKGAADSADRFTAPLTLVMCESCSLVQIERLVPREQLFGSYLWVTGTSSGAKAHAEWLSSRLRERHGRRGRRSLVEVASNDGFFLEHYRRAGFDVLGVDPSNLAEEADARGVPSLRAFFGRAAADRVLAQRGPADVIVARNVLGHSSEMQDLVAGMKLLLAPGGVCVLESPYAYFLREELQYDTIFHEHIAYLTIGSVHNVLARFGLKITDVSCVDMNGGSFLFEVMHADDPAPAGDAGWLAFEQRIRLNEPAGWAVFARRVEAQRRAFRELLGGLAAKRKRVVGYGAAAKCMTMLNYCGITPDLLQAMGDSNPRKQGLLCPGVRMPVMSPQDLMSLRPEYVMIGAWNFRDEIMRLFRGPLGYTGRFILPLPKPSVVG